MDETAPDPTIVLATEGLTKRFGDLMAVDDLSLEIYEGEVFGFLGPNGAGKTTAISMICGLLSADAGQVWIHGEPIQGGAPAVRAKVGICPQHLVIWKDLTCFEQLAFIGQMYGVPRGEAGERADALLESMGLTEKRLALARTLSGGMQRRLNLILALIHNPEIVVLDEPEAGLDPQSRVLVREYIQSLARHKTVILTTHNMDEAERVADRVAIIDRGRLLTVATPEDLKHSVGPGDVLELTLAPRAGLPLAAGIEVVADLVDSVSTMGNTLILRAPLIVERLAGIIEALDRLGLPPKEVRLRENSLEDAFISLTGRRLRE